MDFFFFGGAGRKELLYKRSRTHIAIYLCIKFSQFEEFQILGPNLS